MNQPKIKRDPEGTRRRILMAAAEEFANGGLFGARVDQIARRAETNERMLYYYFGSKEQLFTAVLEHAFFALTEAERVLDLDGVAPVEAVTRLAHFVWDYYRDHPELLRLINNENLHEARYLHKSTRIREMMSPIVAKLGNVLMRGQKAGLFRGDVDPLRFYVTLSGLGYYIVSNRFTLAATLGRDFTDTDERAEMVRMNTEVLLAYLLRR
ncbi:TetR family transcriptional regulator [Burkholderia cenocepacia]|uniref:TetR family transcriptional regulator n=1 Tax=Burkholderia cepacia complex TaxID=87882 RepID=UPI000F586F1C|nr:MULTISPECIES: TetR family transcriptional regulator [Burkholderia cepacia complex]ELW9449237.1 TetR family transcriptional regulator [Burkholderia cenocepacia]MBR8485761.1 TetR family transcriptional regulator [Burkholderia cenocepacia]MDN7472379.1 TetR family transcriptional regulator [Burkholderia orbicola]MDN7507315.1 TetR family transcriptional regulator [Burkholderia orbicola]MDS0849978.1 TetR family transcriptional regulator [Burkholderia cenocepacia]